MTNPQNLESIFFAALERSSNAERQAYLDEACAGDAELRARVARMLSAQAEAGSFLEKAAITAGATLHTMPVSTESAGTNVGRYKLLQPIGEGGFGTVWMAEQREPIKRRVALKIIKLGMDTRQVIARFEAERQALAMMDHPNIAKVFDAGATETGRPYFVMEYIKGVPILEYCDTEKLDTTARLELFSSVCHAIQHAHQKGIIHRDIKPSNVLVTMHDGVPVPKVIDFGIAKATSSELTTKTLFTEHRQMIGTPAYMSPEQAEMSGLDIDTRSDIYSLGVLLYELLTGTTPFAHKELLSKGFAEMMRIIRDVEPDKPSTRLSSLGDNGTRTALQRHAGDLRKLSLILRGDLDWIVMKCLEKDRKRRYETASGLAADIQRHLKDEPVTAGAPGAAYKLRKFVKRNRASVIAGGVIAAALLLGVVGTTTGMVWALSEKTRATAAKEEETKARERAETTAKFVTTALKSSDARNDGGGQDVTVWAAMGNAIKDIDSGRFKDDPETEAALQDTIAMILISNGRYAEALPLYAQALETRQRILPGDNAYVGDSLNHLALVLLVLCRFEEAEPVAVRALEMNRRLHPGDHKDVGDSLNYLARARLAMGRVPEAEELYVQSLEMWQRLHPGDNVDVAVCLSTLAEVRGVLGRLDDAERLYVQALEMNQRLYKGDYPNTANAIVRLAIVRQAQGRNAEAERQLVQALEMQQRIFKGDHPDVADSLFFLAQGRRALGRLQEGEALAVQAMEMCKRLFPSDHVALAKCVREVGTARMTLGRPAEAEPLFMQALEMYQRLFKRDHPQTAECLNDVANARLTRGNPAEAEPLFNQALEMNRRLFKGDHSSIASNLSNLARTRQAVGKTAEARQGFDEAIAMMRRLSPQGSPLLIRILWRSGTARLDNNDASAALPELQEAVTMAERIFPPGHPDLTGYQATLAKCKAAR